MLLPIQSYGCLSTRHSRNPFCYFLAPNPKSKTCIVGYDGHHWSGFFRYGSHHWCRKLRKDTQCLVTLYLVAFSQTRSAKKVPSNKHLFCLLHVYKANGMRTFRPTPVLSTRGDVTYSRRKLRQANVVAVVHVVVDTITELIARARVWSNRWTSICRFRLGRSIIYAVALPTGTGHKGNNASGRLHALKEKEQVAHTYLHDSPSKTCSKDILIHGTNSRVRFKPQRPLNPGIISPMPNLYKKGCQILRFLREAFVWLGILTSWVSVFPILKLHSEPHGTVCCSITTPSYSGKSS